MLKFYLRKLKTGRAGIMKKTAAQTFGGQSVDLTFSIWNLDWEINPNSADDTLKIDDIAFNKNPAPVPVPGTLLLLCSGLVGLGVLGRRKR